MMFRRGFALCLVLGLASFARAQTATISFSPNGGNFQPNQNVDVDVLVTPAIGANKLLRYAQLDYSASNASLLAGLSLPTTHANAVPSIQSFVFTGVGACVTGAEVGCGTGHYYEDTQPGGLRPNIIAIAYKELVADATKQITLANGVAKKIATIRLHMPAAPGNYGKLDVLNAAVADADKGGELRWGFGITGDTDLVRLRANAGISGGVSNDFIVTEICPAVTTSFASALPAMTASAGTIRVMSRTTKNETRIDFTAALPSDPPAGSIKIREILTGAGNFGPEIPMANFTFSRPSANRLRIQDNGSNLVHRKWYQIEYPGCTWPGVDAFCLQFVVQAGDCDGSNSVNAADLSCINLLVPTLPAAAAADDKFFKDINAGTGISAADLSAANAQIPSLPVAKPSGHTTCP